MTTRLILGDCLEAMRGLESGSVDAVITDPPYFRVKGEAWDRQWDSAAAFLAWLDTIAAEWQRVLKPNGSLYCFAAPRMAARVEVLLGVRFNVLSHIVWKKHDGSGAGTGGHSKVCKESLRQFFPQSERIIFAEHHGADSMALGESGYAAQCETLRGFVFEPLRAYLDGERRRAGVDFDQVRVMVGCAPGSGLPSHWFTRSQWMLPTQTNYDKLRAGFNAAGGDYLRREYDDLRREYDDLRREYDDLRREYDDLRRPFAVTADVPYTDVWDFATVSHYPGKHPCEKPQALLRHIVRTSTRPGAVILDSFMGTGSMAKAAQAEGRHFIGIERDSKYFSVAQQRIANAQPALMAAD